MTKTEKILLFLRLLKTHRDGLSANELKAMLQIGSTAFYNYLGQLRRMSFNITCRNDGRYILILDKISERLLVDYFPEMLVNPSRKAFKRKHDFIEIYKQIYSVTEKNSSIAVFFRDIPSVCLQYPELEKNMLYWKWTNKDTFFETENYIITAGPLLAYKDKAELQKTNQ